MCDMNEPIRGENYELKRCILLDFDIDLWHPGAWNWVLAWGKECRVSLTGY